jgi:hypothetical protein
MNSSTSNSTSNSTAKWLAVIVVLQVVTMLGQWVAVPGATPAQGQALDAGAQRMEIISQLKGTNDKLDRLLSLLAGGNLQVKVVKPDDTKGR